MRSTYSIKLNRHPRLIMSMFAVALLSALIIATFITSLGPRTYVLFESREDDPNLRNTWDSVHLDENFQPIGDPLTGNYFFNDVTFINLLPDRLKSADKISIDSRFMLSSGVSNIEIFLDTPGSKPHLLYSRLLENIDWESKTESNVVYWDRAGIIESLADITRIGENQDLNILLVNTDLRPNLYIADHEPSNELQKIYMPIRRSFSGSFYVGDEEEITMTFFKRDLNIYSGKDETLIRILNNKEELVSEYKIADDGVNVPGDFANFLATETITEQLDTGLYYLQVVQDDSVIEYIETNLTKLVINENIFIANNEAYSPEVQPLEIYTDAAEVSLTAIHDFALQEIEYGDSTLEVTLVNQPYNLFLRNDELTRLYSPIGDIFIQSDGVFAPRPEFYFDSTPFDIYSLSDYNSRIDYDLIIAEYSELKFDSGYYIQRFEIDLPEDLPIENSRLVVKMEKASPNDGVLFNQFDLNY